jgi:hypothetical protein
MNLKSDAGPGPAGQSQNESVTTKESSRLTQLESLIDTAEESFGEAISKALWEINETRLYRAEYRTWEEYCKKRWGYCRSYMLTGLIAFAKMTSEESMSPNGDTPERVSPKNEGSFRASKIAKKVASCKGTKTRPSQPQLVPLSRYQHTTLGVSAIRLAR